MRGVPFDNDYKPVKLLIAPEDRRKVGVSDIQVPFHVVFDIFRRGVRSYW